MAGARKTSGKKTRSVSNPNTASWQELSETIPRNHRRGFQELVLRADIGGELAPAWLVKQYPNHPVVSLVKRFLETGNKRLIAKAKKAAAGTDKNYELLLMKS